MAAGFEPSRDTLKKIRRRCIRETDYDSDDRVQSIVRSLKIQMGSEGRRGILFELDYSTEYA